MILRAFCRQSNKCKRKERAELEHPHIADIHKMERSLASLAGLPPEMLKPITEVGTLEGLQFL